MPNFKKNTSPAMKKSAYKMKGFSYPGESPAKQNYGKKSGKLKKTEIGPEVKPMVDNDGDGIPVGVDANDNSNYKTETKRDSHGTTKPKHKMSKSKWWNAKTQSWE